MITCGYRNTIASANPIAKRRPVSQSRAATLGTRMGAVMLSVAVII
jgi:hypothetical protein